MKKIVSILAITLALVSCKDNDKKPETQEIEKQEVNYTSVGMEINDADALPAARMAEHYKAMKVGDTVNSKMSGKVEEVCQSKGCWMKVDLENGEQVMVKFKDYAFFMPKDLAGKEVVLNGKAFVNEVPVDEQRHYAEDGGATPEEIAAITAPKKTFSFEADGVLIKQ